jgi:hypothetical protein
MSDLTVLAQHWIDLGDGPKLFTIQTESKDGSDIGLIGPNGEYLTMSPGQLAQMSTTAPVEPEPYKPKASV